MEIEAGCECVSRPASISFSETSYSKMTAFPEVRIPKIFPLNLLLVGDQLTHSSQITHLLNDFFPPICFETD